MSERLRRVIEDVQELDEELADIRADLSELRRRAAYSGDPHRHR